MEQQHTIARAVSRRGIGVHSGETASVTIRPAGPDEGVRFVRTDVAEEDRVIHAHALNVAATMLGTSLSNARGVSVATVEHLLAACSGLGIDNLVVELDGPETPILDGSSAPFADMLREAGREAQATPQRRLKILKPVEVRDGVKWVRLSPGEGFEMRIAIEYPSKAIGRQTFAFRMTPGAFEREIAWARTFGFLHEVEQMRAMGRARGGSLDNAIVIDGDRVMNEGGLNAPDEFVRHKLIDVVGDLFLAGGPIEGLYEGEQPGHALNNRLLRALLADEGAYAWVT